MTVKEELTEKTPQVAVSLLRRVGAIFYDAILIASLIFIIAQWSLLVDDTAKEQLWFRTVMLFNIFGVAFIYLGWFWTHRGQTVGMRAWKIRLQTNKTATADKNAGDIGWLQAFVRYAVAMVSWLFCGLGYWWALFNRKKLAWHDMASNSRLIRTDISGV